MRDDVPGGEPTMNIATSSTPALRPAAAPDDPARTDFDVLIVGAGISGIDAAKHLIDAMPGARFALIDRQAEIGGTWRTHVFPGIRSDSDLYTFGFAWKPWTGLEIATAGEILKYLDEAVEDLALGPHIRFRRNLAAADWDSSAGLWRLTVEDFDAHRQKLDYFHLDYMACNAASAGFARKLDGKAVRAILPQHGSIIPERLVPEALDYLTELQCGLDLLYPDLMF